MKYLVNPIPPFAANAPGNAGADARVFTISPEHSSLVLTLRDEVALTQLPEKFIHVSAGVDGEVWAIDASHRIFRRTGSTWTQISGTLKQVSVGSPEHIWGVQGDGDIFRWTGESWQKISGTLKQVAVASDGAVWGVQGDGDIFVRRGDKWEQISGTLAQIAVGSRRNVWGVQADGDVFVRTGDKWIKVATGLKQVSIATDGAVWAVDPLSRLHRWDGKTFELQPGALTQISVGSASDIWGVDAVNRTWFNGGAAKALLVQQIWAEDERQQWRFIRQDDGSFRVQNVASGLVLDVRGASKNDEADVLGFPWHGGDNQRWLLTELGDGRFSISAKHSGKSLDVFRAFREAGAKLIQFTWHSNANQRFRLAEVRPSSAIFNASATLFADRDFAGASVKLGVGCYSTADLASVALERVSSLKVPQGLRVTLCELPEYKGRRKSFTADAAFVGDDFDGLTSTVMVEKVVTIFQHSNFQGAASTIGIGKHNVDGLGIPDNSLSSLRVPQGLMVVTYEEPDFKGAQRIYFEDTPNVGAGFHDKVSSINIRKIGIEIPHDGLRYGGGLQIQGARGRWMVAENDGRLLHTSLQPGTKETFTIERNGPTQHTSHVAFGDIISLRSSSGKYVSAKDDGTANASPTTAGAKERWIIVRTGATKSNVFVSHGDVISLRSWQGLFLVADTGSVVNANRTEAKSLERWTITGYTPPNTVATTSEDSGTGGGPCGAAVCAANVCAVEACGADACAAEACGIDAALAGACGAAVSGVAVCGADVSVTSACGAAACGAAACGADACGAGATGIGVCGAAACGAAACGADACGAAACGAEACGAAACGVDANPVDACGADAGGIDVCPVDACGANVCGLNLCPADACAADACAVDIIPIIPGI
ncbi:MAG: Cys-every-fifth RiPP peptide CefA [Myxococcales bacterium]|nr:Cys-every-fifth RiPP peptide CefA [Myxococcales bacterium]